MDNFYRAFEDRHRGSRDLILGRLRKYLPFVEPLAALYPGDKTFDLGCGRGEWLEVMAEAGFAPTGADLDADMLDACRERNLPAFQGDAIAYLATLESNSHALISAFHVVEHVSFEQLGRIVTEALRVLKPGGLLILETPNPENITVATCNFYVDPSHQKPIPPLLLSFVAEHAGFDRVKVVRLQEVPEFVDAATEIHFLDILRGASPDYAIVAQKDASSTGGAFDEAFATEYGLTIDALAQRYEAQIASSITQFDARIQQMGSRVQSVEGLLRVVDGRLQSSETRLQSAEVRLQSAETRLQYSEDQYRRVEGELEHTESMLRDAEERARHAEGLAQQANSHFDDMLRDAEERAMHAEALAQQAQVQLRAVYLSTSWRITAPMRWVRLVVRGGAVAPAKRALKPLVLRSAQYTTRRPWVRRIVVAVLNRMPRVKARLAHVVAVSPVSQALDPTVVIDRIEGLDEHANRIHASLIAEFEKSPREKN